MASIHHMETISGLEKYMNLWEKLTAGKRGPVVYGIAVAVVGFTVVSLAAIIRTGNSLHQPQWIFLATMACAAGIAVGVIIWLGDRKAKR